MATTPFATSTARKVTAQDRRNDWMQSVFAPINDYYQGGQHNGETFPVALADEALARIAAEGPAQGRTERWQAAVAWFAASVKDDPTSEAHRRWVVTQGSVWLGYANL